jgi:hypothetical protein
MKHPKSWSGVWRAIGLGIAALTVLAGCSSGGVVDDAGRPISDVYGLFVKGDLRLKCEFSCAFASGAHRKEIGGLYQNQLWKDLALSVAEVNFSGNLSYFYLGRAAEGLGLYQTADIYYRLSNAASYKCPGDQCEGIVLPFEAKAGLERIASVLPRAPAPMAVPPAQAKASTFSSTAPAVKESSEAHLNTNTQALPAEIVIRPVSAAEWKEIIGGQDNAVNIDFLDRKAYALVEIVPALIEAGNKQEASEKILRILTITQYRRSIKEDDATDRTITATKKYLSSQGVKQSVIDGSIINFKNAFPSYVANSSSIKSSTEKSNKFVPPRKPSVNEEKLLKAAVRAGLKDPDSARFGPMLIYKNKHACVDVNAKNAFGGYVGAHTIFVSKTEGGWSYILDMIKMSTCQIALIKFEN